MSWTSQLLSLVGLCIAAQALAHGERPIVMDLYFPGKVDGSPWVLTDSQGLFTRPKDNFRWLCEDAVNPSTALLGLHIDVLSGDRFLLATNHGLMVTEDGGCFFERANGPLGHIPLFGLWSIGDTLVTVSEAPRHPTRLWRSADQGRTWQVVRDLGPSTIHSVATNDVTLYLAHDSGLVVLHDDGRATSYPWRDNEMGTPLLLGVHPQISSILFLALESLPESRIMRSMDSGQSWSEVLRVPDLGLGLVSDRPGEEFLLYGPLGLGWRSTDAGLSWHQAEAIPSGLVAIKRPQNGNRLYGSTDVFGGGLWTLGYSDDLGRSWTVELLHFSDAVEVWDCAPDAPARYCCVGLCPGLPPGSTCDGVSGSPNVCQPLGGHFVQTMDMGEDFMATGGISADAVGGEMSNEKTPEVDLIPMPATGRHGDGCFLGLPTLRGPSPAWSVVLLSFVFGYRRWAGARSRN